MFNVEYRKAMGGFGFDGKVADIGGHKHNCNLVLAVVGGTHGAHN